MKLRIILTAATLALSFTACSTKNKKEEAPKDAAATATATPTPAPDSATASKLDKKMKKGKKMMKNGASDAAHSADAVTCSQGSDVRMIETKAADSGCELVYTKNGDSKSVATARSGMEYCQAAGEKLKNTLAEAGMDCK